MLWDLITDLHDWPPQIDFFFYRSRLGFFFFSAPPCPHHCSKTHQPWFKWMGGLTSHCNDSSASSSVRSYLGKVGLLVKCYSLNSMMIETPGFPTQCYNVHWWSGPWCWIIVHPSRSSRTWTSFSWRWVGMTDQSDVLSAITEVAFTSSE